MTSFEFEFDVSEKDLAGAAFVLETGRHLAAGFISQCRSKGMTKKQIADQLGIDKSTVSKMLRGNANMTLETVGELCWAMGMKAKFTCAPVIQENAFIMLAVSSAATAAPSPLSSFAVNTNSVPPSYAMVAR